MKADQKSAVHFTLYQSSESPPTAVTVLRGYQLAYSYQEALRSQKISQEKKKCMDYKSKIFEGQASQNTVTENNMDYRIIVATDYVKIR